MKKLLCACVAMLLCIAVLIPTFSYAEARMEGNTYCPRCGSLCHTRTDGGNYSSRTLYCSSCKKSTECIYKIYTYYYYCTNCDYEKEGKTVRYYQCTECNAKIS